MQTGHSLLHFRLHSTHHYTATAPNRKVYPTDRCCPSRVHIPDPRGSGVQRPPQISNFRNKTLHNPISPMIVRQVFAITLQRTPCANHNPPSDDI